MAEGYGSEIYCYDEIRTGRLVTGVEVVAQALYRRLTTPRGTLRGGEDESVYGLDLLDFIGRVGTAAAVDALPGVIEAECMKDDRVSQVDCTVTQTVSTDGLMQLTIVIDALLHNPGDAFALTVAVSDVGVSMIGFEAT